MPLAPGTRVGPYEVLAALGRGGMGEVWRARDTTLGREVALKALPPQCAGDADRLARFEREAKALAALNHPRIAAIYGLEDVAGQRVLVMELALGTSLANRLARGPLPVRDALGIGRQIAEGIEAAHEKGIIHRDLKPANIHVTDQGEVKILDFGLAKALIAGSEDPASSPNPETSPTLTAPTRHGVILGTAAYMSPEQARGLPVDARTDIWAFGCVLYECLAGKGAFAGETVTDVLAAVLDRDPDWGALPATTPPGVRTLLARCLRKDPSVRLHDVADARIELDDALREGRGGAGSMTPAGSAPPRLVGQWTPRLSWAALGLAVGAALGVAASLWLASSRVAEAPRQLSHLSIVLSATEPLMANTHPRAGASVAISRDGRRVVYTSRRNGSSMLVLRSLDRADETVLRGTEGAFSPFFSPDGSWVAFFTEQELKKVQIGGGGPVTVCPTPPVGRGGTWSDDDTIYVAQDFTSGLQRVAASGGQPQPMTTLDLAAKEGNHLLPEALPGGDAVLFTVWKGGTFEEAAVWAVSARTGKRTLLVERASNARYLSQGYLVFARSGSLFAAPFDAKALSVRGPAVPVVEGVWNDPSTGTAHYALSQTGTLVYAPGGYTLTRQRLVWVDRHGRSEFLPLEPGFYNELKLSPDGRRLAVQVLNDIWVYDLQNRTMIRATFRGVNQAPVWTPDGRHVAFSSSRDVTRPTLYWIDPEAGGEPEMLSRDGEVQFPSSWSPDGRTLAYAEIKLVGSETGYDIWLLTGGGPWTRQRLLATPFQDDQPVFSPDGRALVWASNDTGRTQIYVRAYPGMGRTIVSTDGGTEPVWARNGRELFYRNGRRLYSVPINTQGDITVGRASLLFEGDFARGSITPGIPAYDVAPDGQHFVMVTSTADAELPVRLDVVLNWLEGIKRRAPGRPAE